MARDLRDGGMAMIAFLQAQNCSNFPGSWRHPGRDARFHVRQILSADRPHA